MCRSRSHGNELFPGLPAGEVLTYGGTMQQPIQGRTQRVIGSVFPLHEPAPRTQTNRNWPFLHQGVLHLASARGAFSLLARALRPRRVWLPSYLCSSILEGFPAASCVSASLTIGA